MSHDEYKVVPTYKGTYEESMPAAIAAFRAGNAPHILQVFEVGTATMMAARGAIVPVGKVMADAGFKFDPSIYVPAVAGYYTAPSGQMLSSRSTARPPSSTTTRTTAILAMIPPAIVVMPMQKWFVRGLVDAEK